VCRVECVECAVESRSPQRLRRRRECKGVLVLECAVCLGESAGPSAAGQRKRH
jgi:hypothetical protein